MRRLLVACLILGACGTGAHKAPTEVRAKATQPDDYVVRLSSTAVPTTVPPTIAPEPPTTTTTVPEPTTTTTEPPRPPVTAASRSRGAPNWEALRQCESGGNYSTNTGNGYFGAYQFSPGTWQGLGYEGRPSDAPPETQDEAAQRLYMARGASPWPTCGRKL